MGLLRMWLCFFGIFFIAGKQGSLQSIVVELKPIGEVFDLFDGDEGVPISEVDDDETSNAGETVWRRTGG